VRNDPVEFRSHAVTPRPRERPEPFSRILTIEREGGAAFYWQLPLIEIADLVAWL